MPESVIDDLHTVRDFVRWGASRLQEAGAFFGHGCDSALDEAAYLVAHAVHLSPSVPEGLVDGRLTRSERQRVVELFERRIETRKPAPYLTGEAWFAGLRFVVDERVLVPRSPIAELIEQRFEPWLAAARPAVLDLCTGSGCIAVACARYMEATVDAADISSDVLAVAGRNIRDHGVEDRVTLIRSDLFDVLGGRRYDLIVSNPPYVGGEELATLPAEYRHEPDLALRSGADGLDLPLRILARAPDHLNPGGILVLEVGFSAPALDAALPDMPWTWLELERGGEGVLLAERELLAGHHDRIVAVMRQRGDNGE